MRVLPELHRHHQLPIHSLDSLEEFEPSAGNGPRIYQLPIGDGMLLGFAGNPIPSQDQVLQITLHERRQARKDFFSTGSHHRFEAGNHFLFSLIPR